VDESSAWSAPESFVCNLNAQNTVLAGYLIEARRPADTGAANSVSGNLVVDGAALVFQNPSQNNPFEFEATSVNAPSPALARSNFDVVTPLRPENLPMLPLPEAVTTGGFVAGDRTGVSATGTMTVELQEIAEAEGQVIQATDVISANGIESDGAGVVTITVGHFNLLHTVIQGDLVTLNLIGQADAAEAVAVEYLAPVILLTNTATLTNVNFTAFNRRPLILAHATSEANSSQVIAYSLPDGADFRMFFVQQDANTAFLLAGSATVRGGLALDFGASVAGGTLVVAEETNKYIFQALLPRSAWLETYRQL
jgi:hypothetical protein